METFLHTYKEKHQTLITGAHISTITMQITWNQLLLLVIMVSAVLSWPTACTAICTLHDYIFPDIRSSKLQRKPFLVQKRCPERSDPPKSCNSRSKPRRTGE